MGSNSTPNRVYYCCVSKGGRILYAYNNGRGQEEHEIEKVAPLCVERAPPYHRWYFQTLGMRTYGFFMEDDGFVYFAIADERVGNASLGSFLLHIRDDFESATSAFTTTASPRKGKRLRASHSSLNSGTFLLERQLLPVIRRLVSSLEQVSALHDSTLADRASTVPPPGHCIPETEAANSGRAPLLGTEIELGMGRNNKQEKKKKKLKEEYVVMDTREIELGDSGLWMEPMPNQGSSNNHSISLHKDKDLGSTRMIRSASQSIRKKWCHRVLIILVIDVIICILLFVILFGICRGFHCIH